MTNNTSAQFKVLLGNILKARFPFLYIPTWKEERVLMNLPINPLSKQLLIKMVLLISVLLLTIFLVAKTLNIQHSCHPMIAWSDISLPPECRNSIPAPETDEDKKTSIDLTPNPIKPGEVKQTPDNSTSSTPQPREDKKTPDNSTSSTPQPREDKKTPDNSTSSTPQPREDKKTPDSSILPDVIGVGASSVALVGLAIIEAPVTVAVGAGIAIWFVVRTAIKAMNGI